MPLNEEEWPLAEDGLPTRDAARVILINPDGQILLVRGHDFSAPETSWWFTIGGGLEPGEDARQAAVRECWEEAQIRVDAHRLIGPVISRDSIFHFADRDRRQRETFFLAHTTHQQLRDELWTQLEREVLDEMRWMSLGELNERSQREQIYPQDLPALVSRWLTHGWDGECVKIYEYSS